MVRGHRKFADITQGDFGTLSHDIEQSVLRRRRGGCDQIHDRALMLADNACMGLVDEIFDRSGMPVIAASKSAGAIHSLLNNSPFAIGSYDQAVKVKLKPIGDGIIVDTRRETTGAYQAISVETGAVRVTA